MGCPGFGGFRFCPKTVGWPRSSSDLAVKCGSRAATRDGTATSPALTVRNTFVHSQIPDN